MVLAAAFLAPTVPAAAGSGDDPAAQLRVAPEGSRDGYDRALFPHWRDLDGDGCDTRSEVLIAESRRVPTVDPSCRVTGGEWVSVYDGVATSDPRALEIDHVVALAEVWESDGATWDRERRRAFANDLDHPASLIAVTIHANRSKGDSDPAEWQPPDPGAGCAYGRAWVATKAAWDLAADQAEVDALRSLLATCPTDP